MNRKSVCRFLYAVILVAASVPVACGYIMAGGNILLWIARLEEVREGLTYGSFVMYPSAELISAYGGQLTAFDSNLWLIFPAMIRLAGGSIVTVYRLFMLFIQIGTLFTAVLMFRSFFREEVTVLFGVLLYMTCPYRLYICYDRADLAQAVVWLLIPLLVWGVLEKEKISGSTQSALSLPGVIPLVVSSAALAGIGYASGIMLIIAAGLIILAALSGRSLRLLIPAAVGTLLYLPGGIRLLQYLLHGITEIENMPLAPISGKGYYFGQFFSSFAYQEGMPGLGLGLLMALFLLLWFLFCNGRAGMSGRCRRVGELGLLLLCFSLHWFPWDVMQRIGGIFLRTVALFGTPGIFFGLACIALSVPGAFAVEKAGKETNGCIRAGVPVILFTAAIGLAVYLCNTLTFSRMPLDLTGYQ